MNFEAINEAIDSRLHEGGPALLVSVPLYQHTNAAAKKVELLYNHNGTIDQFMPNDTFSLIIGHLPISGRFNPAKPVYEAWTHEVELIVIGAHKYLEAVLYGVAASANVISYDLRGTNIWRQYFGMEEYPENQVFTIRYQIVGDMEPIENYCKEC